MLDPEAIAIDPDLLLFNAGKAKSGGSGSRAVVFSDSRGRYVKPMLPAARSSASPWMPPCGRQRRIKKPAVSGNRTAKLWWRTETYGPSNYSARPVPW